QIAAIPTLPTMVIHRVKAIIRIGSLFCLAVITWITKNPAIASGIKEAGWRRKAICVPNVGNWYTGIDCRHRGTRAALLAPNRSFQDHVPGSRANPRRLGSAPISVTSELAVIRPERSDRTSWDNYDSSCVDA